MPRSRGACIRTSRTAWGISSTSSPPSRETSPRTSRSITGRIRAFPRRRRPISTSTRRSGRATGVSASRSRAISFTRSQRPRRPGARSRPGESCSILRGRRTSDAISPPLCLATCGSPWPAARPEQSPRPGLTVLGASFILRRPTRRGSAATVPATAGLETFKMRIRGGDGMPRITPDVNTGNVSRRGFLRLSALASAGLASGAAVLPALAQTAPKKGGTLRVGFYLEASTMDPHLSGSKVDRQIYHNIYEPLITLDTNLGLKPGLAESWQQPDAKTLVLKLRRGVKFHDGTDFNAEVAKFNFNRMKTEPKSVRKGETASIDTVDVVDAYTIKINLKRPDAALLATLTDRAGMMVSPKVIQERGPELERNAKGAGTGPFEFVEWIKDDHLIIKRNDSYWNKQGGPYLDRIRYRPIPDDTVKLQSLQSGEIDVIDYVQPRDVAAVKADKSVSVLDVPSLAAFAYQLNQTRPPFNNKVLRQAVAYSLDLEQIVKGVWLHVR